MVGGRHPATGDKEPRASAFVPDEEASWHRALKQGCAGSGPGGSCHTPCAARPLPLPLTGGGGGEEAPCLTVEENVGEGGGHRQALESAPAGTYSGHPPEPSIPRGQEPPRGVCRRPQQPGCLGSGGEWLHWPPRGREEKCKQGNRGKGGGGESLRPHPGGKSGLGPLPGRGRLPSVSVQGLQPPVGGTRRLSRGESRRLAPRSSVPRPTPHCPLPQHTHREQMRKLRLESKDRSPGRIGPESRP